MSRKQRRKNRQNKPKHQATVPVQSTDTPEPVTIDTERFVLVNEIANRLNVTGACVRQWGRQGKIVLRKLFGSTGPYGMPESQLIRLIRGESEY